ncbi:hypothetical protein ACHAQA_002370 [Verticillium albo-atrum]
MGLAEIKFRRKIDKDPNNTAWAKDTSTFGQKILRSQGWEPGQYLGAKDAAQAEHYTAANASFVRVSLKDDMLGLGFKQAKEERSTGMDAFQNMLARLNGKSEVEIQKEQQAKQAVASSLYCDSKFGPMRFVRGGWLVGDKEQKTTEDEKKEEDDEEKAVKVEDVPEVSLKEVSKKRKAEEVSSDSDSSSSEDEKAKKKRRKEERKAAKKQKSKSAKTTPNDTQDDTEEGSSKSKKSKKEKKAKLGETDSSAAEDKEAKKKRRQEKKERKAKKAAADDSDSDSDKAAKKEKKRRKKELKKAEEAAKASASRSVSGTATPASGTSTPVLRGHHAVRSRWIASKRMATMDDTALNQIFGIKASS